MAGESKKSEGGGRFIQVGTLFQQNTVNNVDKQANICKLGTSKWNPIHFYGEHTNVISE